MTEGSSGNMALCVAYIGGVIPAGEMADIFVTAQDGTATQSQSV